MTAPKYDDAELTEAVRLACRWLVDVAQVKQDSPPAGDDTRDLAHRHWRGAMRGEYSAGTRQWMFFCPIWHTGQAVKALVMAHKVLGDAALLDAARISADFIGAERVSDAEDEDHGLIFAYEDFPDAVNTSAILECLDGLLHLADATGERRYRQWALEALDWVARKSYRDGEGVFHDCYRPATRQIAPPRFTPPPGFRGRPLLDDAVFLKGYRLGGDERFRRIFFETADRLLADEDPEGNWVTVAPCSKALGRIHPRHAYWWGRPMLAAWAENGDQKYRRCALRSAEWYRRALRRDGGCFRNTYLDFNTDSFGHATSGSACAAVFFQQIEDELGQTDFRQAKELALGYCLRMQLRDVADGSLRGAILEKVLPPDNTDRHPFHLRDLGTIFFVQAAVRVLCNAK